MRNGQSWQEQTSHQSFICPPRENRSVLNYKPTFSKTNRLKTSIPQSINEQRTVAANSQPPEEC
jgi:hypothetical protein